MKKTMFLLCCSLVFASCSKERRSNKAGEKMQQFVQDISAYAKGIKSNFFIIPQNGSELAFNHLDPSEGRNEAYLSVIDGIGIEELFYDGNYSPDQEDLERLRTLVNSERILVSENITDAGNIPDAVTKNSAEGFLCFPRDASNYDYINIPSNPTNEHNGNVSSLSDAKNYLYLINSKNFPTKQSFLDALAATNYDILLIDLFYENESFTASEINQLKTKANGGTRLVIAYMNVGSAENYRYYWKDNWKKGRPNWLAKPYEGYADEIWVKFWKDEWRAIIFGNDNSYTKRIIDAGFDGAYLDNVEAYYFLYFE